MEKIIFINRNKSSGFSIHKVFKPVIHCISEKILVEEYSVPFTGGNPINIFKNLYFVYKLRNKIDVFHITGDIHYVLLSLIGCRTVLTIHDLVMLKNAKNKLDYFLKWLIWVYLPVKIAREVVCISDHTRLSLLKVVNKCNIHVIHNPIAKDFIIKEECKNIIPKILHIGTGWNKNLENVCKSLKGIECELRIIGELSGEQLEQLKNCKINYYNNFNLTDQEIVEEYSKCDIVSFPSIYEGFGMPIIEAQAMGKPVVTSDRSPMIEVSNNTALLVDPLNVDHLRESFLLLMNNKEFYNRKVCEGLNNIKRFDLDLISNKYIRLYKSIL